MRLKQVDLQLCEVVDTCQVEASPGASAYSEPCQCLHLLACQLIACHVEQTWTLWLQSRAAILTASQCATYDEIKRAIVKATGWSDGAHLHLAASLVAGVISTTACNPVDVIKCDSSHDINKLRLIYPAPRPS